MIHKFTYTTRAIAAWLWFLICCALVAVFVFPFRWKDPSLNNLLGRMAAWGGLKLIGLRVNVEHHDRLDQHQPCVYVGNHQSNWDVLTFGGIVPRRTLAIGKKELLWIPIFGLLFVGMGNVLIDRKRHRAAVSKFQAAMAALKERGNSIWIFPEGHRNRGAKQMLPFKKGAFHLAIEAQVPIVPLVQSRYIDVPNKRFTKKRASTIKVLEPIPTKGRTLADVPKLMAEVRGAMEKAQSTLEP